MREKIFIFKQIDRSTLCHEFKYSSLSIRPIRLKKKTLNCLSHLSQSRSRITNKDKSDDRTFVKKKKNSTTPEAPYPQNHPSQPPPPHQKNPQLHCCYHLLRIILFSIHILFQILYSPYMYF